MRVLQPLARAVRERVGLEDDVTVVEIEKSLLV